MPKVTITISEQALSKIEVFATALDISPNLYIKQVTMNHINKNDFTWFTTEQRQALKDFSTKQGQLINTLNKIEEEYLKQNISFPTDKIKEYFKSYHKHFKICIERLDNANN